MLAWLGLVITAFGLLAPTEPAVTLNVPYRNQLDGSSYAWANCGPTSLAMVLAYYGIDEPVREVRLRAMRAQDAWDGEEHRENHDRYGVFVYNLATVAESFGLRAEGLWRREAGRVDTLHQWQPADLRRVIRESHPAIVEVRYGALPDHRNVAYTVDHYIVVHGMLGQDFVYSDPLGRYGGSAKAITEADLMHAMSQASAPRVGFAAYRPVASGQWSVVS